MKPKAPIKYMLIGIIVVMSLQLSASANGFRLDLPQDTISKYGQDSATCVMNISLYREFYRQWKASNYDSPVIKEILNPWRWVFKNCPIGSENTYVDGVKIVQYRIENEKNEAAKSKLIDTLMMVYDQRIQYFPNHYRTGNSQVGAIMGRKGVDLFTYDQDRYEEAYNILKESVEIDGNDSDGTVLIYYFRSVIKMARKAKVDTASIIDVYDQVIDILDYNIIKLTKAGDDKWVENYKNFKGNIDATFEPFATGPELSRIYTKKMKQMPNNAELMKKITNILDRKSFQDDPLYLDASRKLYTLEPSPESAYNIGRLLLKEEKYTEAITYFEEATKSDDLVRAHTSYKLLSECLRAVKNYPRARQMALKAIDMNPSDGGPYITLGDIYAASAKDCGDNEFTSRVAFWAAVDKYAQAKRADATLTETANKRIATYSVYFPSLETIFFYDYKEGDTYTIDCWFKEVTTIRASN